MNQEFEKIVNRISEVIFGKREQIRMAVTCLLSRGHLLIEDIPGIGKTSLARTLSHGMGLQFRRIQCTSDMLPGDILGFSVFDQNSGSFTFHQGPVFSNVILVDEINRATPKTQSALLEAMEERQVTIEGETYQLEKPFFVIATQNPKEQFGTFPLPESQLDRFLMRISLGYPDREAEKKLLAGGGHQHGPDTVSAVLDSKSVLAIQETIQQVHLSDGVISYVQDLLDFTRSSPEFLLGLSPRAGLNLLSASRSWAYCHGRDFVLPEDVQQVLLPVTGHRLFSRSDKSELSGSRLKTLFQTVPVP